MNDADDGSLQHAEMRFGAGGIMLGTGEAARGSPGTYLAVEDVDVHHACGAGAGAEILYGPEDTGFGTRRDRARGTKVRGWSFGTYAPSPESAG